MSKLLEVSTDQINVFKTLFETLGETLDNINMIFCRTDKNNEDSSVNTGFIKISEINSSNTVVVNLKLEAAGFTNFYCAEEKVSIGINLSIFNLILKIIAKRDVGILTMYIDYNNTKNLKIIIQKEQKKSIFGIDLFDLKNATINIPNVHMDSRIIMPSNEFHKTCKRMYDITEFVELQCLGNEFVMKFVSDQDNCITTMQYPITNTKHSNKKINTKGTYQLNNLVAFKKLTTMTDIVEIYTKQNYPLVLEYKIPFGRLFLFFSPVTSDDEDNCDEDLSENDKELEEENLVFQENYKKMEEEKLVLQENYKKLEEENEKLKIANKYANELIETLLNQK